MANIDEEMVQVAERILDHIITSLQDERGVRLENAISGAAALAGSYLLKDTGLDLSGLTPGTPVFSDQVDEDGPKVLTVMQQYADDLGLDGSTGWDVEIEANQNPSINEFDLIAKLEPGTSKIFKEFQVPDDIRTGLMAMTAVRIIAMGKDLLSPDTGKSIALNALTVGAKTVPPREQL